MKGYVMLLACLLAGQLLAQNGIIKGRVLDAANKEGIPFANVFLEGTTTGTTTDVDGNYQLENLEPGLYNISASYLGYETQTQFEVQVSNSKPEQIDFELSEQGASSEEVVVKASPFAKTEESPVSLRTIGTAEIQRNPGGNRDISRVVRVLPGVLTTPSFRNDLLIRGGAPNENRFYLDDVEVPNINHFATQGASGGPNGLINVDFIREVDFYSGAFPANRGNALSSVFNFQQKNGRDDRLGFTSTLGTSDLALTLEGPISKKTTFIFSARQSYLQFLFDAIGLPFLPTYNDFQFKVRTRPDEKSEFYVTGLGAIDRFRLNLDANETPEQRFLLNNLPVNNQWNYTLGAVYKRFMEKSYWTFVLSRNMLDNSIFKHEENDESLPRTIDYNSQEIENKLRIENTMRFGDGFKLNFGVNYEYARFLVNTQDFQLVNGVFQPIAFSSTLNLQKYGAFAQLSKKLLQDRLVLSLGTRMDGNDYSSDMSNPLEQFSPRFSLAYAFLPKLPNLSFNFNTGIYYQLPPYPAMGYRDESGALANRENGLSYIRSSHLIGGFEYTTSTNTKFSVEGYYKYYENYPFLLNEGIALANLGADFTVLGNAPVTSIGEGRAYGLEFLAQQRIYKGFYGIFSYTYGFSEFKDADGNFVPSSWDSRHIINVAGGKTWDVMSKAIRANQNGRREKKGKAAKSTDVTPQKLELGLNVRYQSALPYTPFNIEQSALVQNWDIRGSGIPDFTRLNAERASYFAALDFRIDYKWFFDKWSFNLYLDVQNIGAPDTGLPQLILDEGPEGNQPPTIVNTGQPNESYLLQRLPTTGANPVLPTLGIIVIY